MKIIEVVRIEIGNQRLFLYGWNAPPKFPLAKLMMGQFRQNNYT